MRVHDDDRLFDGPGGRDGQPGIGHPPDIGAEALGQRVIQRIGSDRAGSGHVMPADGPRRPREPGYGAGAALEDADAGPGRIVLGEDVRLCGQHDGDGGFTAGFCVWDVQGPEVRGDLFGQIGVHLRRGAEDADAKIGTSAGDLALEPAVFAKHGDPAH